MNIENLEDWESSPFGPPSGPGVYAVQKMNVFTKVSQILYIGSSGNIFKRVMNLKHPYRKAYDSYSYPECVATLFFECEDYKTQEVRAIKFFKPLLNLQHNGKALH